VITRRVVVGPVFNSRRAFGGALGWNALSPQYPWAAYPLLHIGTDNSLLIRASHATRFRPKVVKCGQFAAVPGPPMVVTRAVWHED
jgi:hypothetical protein